MADESTKCTSLLQESSEDSSLDEFLLWCKENSLILSKKVKVCTQGSSHRYGMIATHDLSQGECIFSIPRKLLLEPKTCSISNVLNEMEGDKNIGISGRGSGWVSLLLALMYEHTNSTSFWRPYLDIIPSIDALDQPMFWDRVSRKRLLKGTEIEEDVEQDLRCIEKEYSSVVQHFMKKNKTQFNQSIHSLDLYKHMAAFVMAYSFTENSPGCQGNNAPVMVPMADILNHHSNNNARLEFAKDELKMVSTQPIAKDQEVFNTYGQLANCHLLQSYGFVENTQNPNDTMEIPISIFYEVLQQDASSKHEARLLGAKFQLMEEMALVSSDDVFVFDFKGWQNQGSDLSLFLKVVHLTEQQLKMVLTNEEAIESRPQDLDDLMSLFAQCSDEQKSFNCEILEKAITSKRRKRKSDHLLDENHSNDFVESLIEKKKLCHGGMNGQKGEMTENVEKMWRHLGESSSNQLLDEIKQESDDDHDAHEKENKSDLGRDSGSDGCDDDDGGDGRSSSDDDDDGGCGSDDEKDDDSGGGSDDDDDDGDGGCGSDDEEDYGSGGGSDVDVGTDMEEEDIDNDDDADIISDDDEKIEYLTYDQIMEFPLAWRQTLSRVSEECISRICRLEEDKKICNEHTAELTERETSIKHMLHGLKEILRRLINKLVDKENDPAKSS